MDLPCGCSADVYWLAKHGMHAHDALGKLPRIGQQMDMNTAAARGGFHSRTHRNDRNHLHQVLSLTTGTGESPSGELQTKSCKLAEPVRKVQSDTEVQRPVVTKLDTK